MCFCFITLNECLSFLSSSHAINVNPIPEIVITVVALGQSFVSLIAYKIFARGLPVRVYDDLCKPNRDEKQIFRIMPLIPQI